MSDGEGSAQSATAAVTASGVGGLPDNTTADGGPQQITAAAITKDDGEPNPKKPKLSSAADVYGRGVDKQPSASDKLEHRLGGILCCAVCLDLPRAAIYQVRTVVGASWCSSVSLYGPTQLQCVFRILQLLFIDGTTFCAVIVIVIVVPHQLTADTRRPLRPLGQRHRAAYNNGAICKFARENYKAGVRIEDRSVLNANFYQS